MPQDTDPSHGGQQINTSYQKKDNHMNGAFHSKMHTCNTDKLK